MVLGPGSLPSAFRLFQKRPVKNLLLDSMRTLDHSCLFFPACSSTLWTFGESPSLRSLTGSSEVGNRWTCHAGAGKEPAKRMAGLSWNGEIASHAWEEPVLTTELSSASLATPVIFE